MSAAATLAAGLQVGDYRIDGLIGEGGMGYVYRAVGPDGREVALKMVKSDVAADEAFRRRFAREARAAQRVNDSHVVPVVGEGEHDGRPYLVQKLIPGGSLAQRLEAGTQPAPAEVVRICNQVAAGLAAMHRCGLVHRDVKPGNILLDRDGRAYIADFGLVKVRQASVLTQPGRAVGSVDYMAPEQVRGEEVSAATDTYALGCVVYECLTGAAPFADRRGMRVMWAHLQDEPADPCAKRPDLPAELGSAVCLALRKQPEERPPTPIAYARMMQVAAGLPPIGSGAG
jgi:serine/threonine protein kinase